MTEKTLEKKFSKEIEKLGGKAVKFYSPYFTGMTDRIIILPRGNIWFVEFKKPGGKLSERQKQVIEWLARLGHNVQVIDSALTAAFLLTKIKSTLEYDL